MYLYIYIIIHLILNSIYLYRNAIDLRVSWRPNATTSSVDYDLTRKGRLAGPVRMATAMAAGATYSQALQRMRGAEKEIRCGVKGKGRIMLRKDIQS